MPYLGYKVVGAFYIPTWGGLNTTEGAHGTLFSAKLGRRDGS
jgi:hypothetical protein